MELKTFLFVMILFLSIFVAVYYSQLYKKTITQQTTPKKIELETIFADDTPCNECGLTTISNATIPNSIASKSTGSV